MISREFLPYSFSFAEEALEVSIHIVSGSTIENIGIAGHPRVIRSLHMNDTAFLLKVPMRCINNDGPRQDQKGPTRSV